jgi:hypothetical protein
MKNTYRILRISALILFGLFVSQVAAYAQEEATEDSVQEAPKERPVRPAFESGLLFDAATTVVPPAKTLEMIIQHRFGTIDNKDQTYDFFGIWAPSNIRIGLNYSILDNLAIGAGTTKYKKMQDLQLKYRIIEQTRSNSIPVTVMFYEVVGIDGRPDANWQENYKFGNRISYFSQIIVSRRFNDNFSLQFAPGFTHYNSVDSIYDHDRISLSFAGRYKFTPQGSFIFSADFPLQLQGISEHTKAFNDNAVQMKPNICVGFEVSTSTHAFHIYLASAQGILPQEDIMWNTKDFFKGEVLIGLNITRLWNF